MAQTAAQKLAEFGLTVDIAREFIFAHLNQLDFILSVADAYGVTNAMLAEIVGFGFTAADVQTYFAMHNLDSSVLDPVPGATGTQFLPDDMAQLTALVTLNQNGGGLSNASMRAEVLAALGNSQVAYEGFFDPRGFDGHEDGTFSTAELGFSHLGPLPATQETLESLFYGTIIRLFSNVSNAEVDEMNAYIDAHATGGAGLPAAAMPGFLDIVEQAFIDPAAAADRHIPDEDMPFLAAYLVPMIGSEDNATLFDGLLHAF